MTAKDMARAALPDDEDFVWRAIKLMVQEDPEIDTEAVMEKLVAVLRERDWICAARFYGLDEIVGFDVEPSWGS